MPVLPPLSLARRGPARIRPDLSRIRDALDRLGRPQRDLASILVVGSNGKGSTAVMLEAMLRAHGVATGLYTSPHLVRVEERIRLGGVPLSTPELERHLATLDAFPELTFFETLTAAALLAFADARVGVAVLEAGMGGRWDASRVAGSKIAGLTNIGTDHSQWLGSTREEIAEDKGEALAAAVTAVLGPEVDDAVRPRLGAAHALAAAELVGLAPSGGDRVRVRLDGLSFDLSVPFPGRHQIANLHLALALLVAAHRTGLAPAPRPEAVRAGLAASRWPARLSRHRIAGREVLIDGAHNLEGVRALAEHLAGRERHNLMFSCLADKPLEAMAELLRPVVGSVVVCPLDDERAMPLARLVRAFPEAEAAADPLAALALLPDPVVAAGSLRLAGALLEVEEAT